MAANKLSFFSLKDFRKHLQKFKRRLILSHKQPAQVFDEIYQKNNWGDPETVSGPGSRLNRTEAVRQALPALLVEYQCRSLLDIPCGDFHWMQTIGLDINYIGGDIVGDLVCHNQEQYGNAQRKFMQLDLTHDALPQSDLILCRDCLVHLSYAHIFQALKNVRRSDSKFFLTSTFLQRTENKDILTGEWRTLNLQCPPFNFPPPLKVIAETYPAPNYYDKHLGLWPIAAIPAF